MINEQLTWICLHKFDNDDTLAEHSFTFGAQSKQTSFTFWPVINLHSNMSAKYDHGCKSCDVAMATDVGNQDVI